MIYYLNAFSIQTYLRDLLLPFNHIGLSIQNKGMGLKFRREGFINPPQNVRWRNTLQQDPCGVLGTSNPND